MPESKTTDKAPEAEKKAEPKSAKDSITTSVFAAAGGVPKNQVISAAIASVRDAIPVVFELDAEIVGAKKTTQEGVAGTSFEVKITYTPRELAGGSTDEVNLDAVVKGLEVPQSIDGIHGVEGDPDFLSRKDSGPEFPTK